MKTKKWIIGIIAVIGITLGIIFYTPIIGVILIGTAMVSFGFFFSDARHQRKGWGYLNDTAGTYTGVKNYD
ncbi:MAG: hypothetical protein AB8G11_21165 [Saprospiraceae bacterium]